MNVILHGEGIKIMHLTDTDQVQHKLTVPVKVFSGGTRWEQPVVTDRDMIYKFTYHDGSYYHYQFEEVHVRPVKVPAFRPLKLDVDK
jgi:hypothetical protein